MNNICNEYEAFWNRAYNLNLYPEYVREKYPAVGEEAGD